MTNLTVVVLAAGQGKRMRSDLPKVLHPLAGRPLLAHVLGSAQALRAREMRVVHGHGGELVKQAFAGQPIKWIHQAEQRGTGHAVRQAMPGIRPKDVVLVLYGDVPLVLPETLRKLVSKAAKGQLAILTARLPVPTGYGRIIRGARGKISAIVEEKDATPAQREIDEINTGLLACPASLLAGWTRRLRANNAQKEFYLTDCVGLAVRDGVPVVSATAASADEVLGINDKVQLAEAEAILRRRINTALMVSGVSLADPERLDVRGTLRCGRDVCIDANVIIEGEVVLGDGVQVGPFTLIRDATIGAGTVIHSHCVIEQGLIGARCDIGPYARVRPEVRLADGARLGNFVEIKKSVIGAGSKV
ncbi:MAG: bifunctional UDP-N-acetylglucosamine diphosphorylase/glucosamine-1-phosphate N-acetyltransferase GlmU, partial [Gammaproteobacteria bacterium]|nr:bifunctional UDP-N-acetylglucosamine diphosphorylase/glucosamine-1-phosphate N-acetyltransferase GlmU [Gammaproteobacteria bacterium]